MWDELLSKDRDVFVFLNSMGNEAFDLFWSIFTDIPTWTPLFLIFIFLIFRKLPKRSAWTALGTIATLLVFVSVVVYWVKVNVARIRPANDPDLSALIRAIKHPKDYSFFSGHAAFSFALSTFMYLLLRRKLRWAWLFFLWALLLTYSRIYVGVHYPSDLAVGTFFGVFSGLVFYRFYKRLNEPKIG